MYGHECRHVQRHCVDACIDACTKVGREGFALAAGRHAFAVGTEPDAVDDALVADVVQHVSVL